MKIRHIENSKLAKFLGYDITLYPFIFYIGTPTARTRKHESIHVEQIKRHGVLKFYASYLLHYAAYRVAGNDHQASYRMIPYEIEAYEKEKED